VLGVVYLTGQLTKPPMGLLYANLDVTDAASITQQLQQQNIPFELKGDGTTIYVDQSQVAPLRMRLASQGLPAGQDVGYELFDKGDSFGQTSFHENLNRQRALEGELARTIRSISKIEQARVHLAIPEHELFERDAKPPTASIVVKTRGYLDKETVSAIQHLVASAVEGLDPSNVSIVDERGTLLASGGKSEQEAMATVSIDDKQAAYEDRLRDQITSIVNKYTGTGNAQVQVAADLDFSKITKQSTVYDPDTQVVASTTSTQENETSSDKQENDQTVSVSSSLPNNQTPANTGTGGGTSSSNRSRTEEQTSYQNSSTVSTEVSEPGKLLRLSVAVLVDGSYDTAKDGKKAYKPRAQNELDQIKELIKTGIGFDAKRGDQVTVANLPFAQLTVPEGGDVKAPFLGLTKPDYLYIGQIAGLFVLALILLLLVIRPVLMGLLRTATGGTMSGGQLAIAGAPGAAPMIAAPGTAPPQLIAAQQAAIARGEPVPHLTMASGIGAQIDLAQIEGQVKESSVKKVGEVVAAHPDESLSILRGWMQQPD
ncbi:MAG: flagellar basal-body MS-ring/collar protein FliF, partial [Alphaproteobacteria bacterium]